MIVSEVTEELLQDLFLLIREIGNTIQLMQITQVGKHLVSIRHILVNIVEVGQQQLSPPIEMIERLLNTRTVDETLV